jgi:hypothetical protein
MRKCKLMYIYISVAYLYDVCQGRNKYKRAYIQTLYMEKDEMIEDDETKTTMKVPTDLLDDFKHLAIDMKTTVTALIIESMRLYLKDIKKR